MRWLTGDDELLEMATALIAVLAAAWLVIQVLKISRVDPHPASEGRFGANYQAAQPANGDSND